uniref:Protein-serine/threonine kinase n=1 Tax=Timspurckia oligopyrenoides TaxID=708627 RepID=A0A6T6LWB2_9RHOD
MADTLTTMLHKHEDVVRLLARGVLEFKQRRLALGTSTPEDGEVVQTFLDRFYSSRIGMRLLISQHLAVRASASGEGANGGSRRGSSDSPVYAGIINAKCSPADVVRDAADAVRSLAFRHYGDAPDIVVHGDVDIRFPYVDSYLFFPLFEVLKNSVRATVEKHENADHSMPDVRVFIAGGDEHVTLKISDEGGGIRRSAMPSIWTYLFTTAEVSPSELLGLREFAADDAESSDDSSDEDDQFGGYMSGYRVGLDPIAGFGYGLPLSRLYLRYFGGPGGESGDIKLVSIEGYGTDAYIQICKLGNRKEVLY